MQEVPSRYFPRTDQTHTCFKNNGFTRNYVIRMEEKKTAGWAINFNNNRWGGAGVVIYCYASKERGVSFSSPPLLVVTLGSLGGQRCQEAYILARKKIKEGGIDRYDQFGGKRNKGEKDPRVTASREFEEETWGALCSAEEIRKLFFDYDSETNLPSSSLTFSAGHLEFYVKVRWIRLILFFLNIFLLNRLLDPPQEAI